MLADQARLLQLDDGFLVLHQVAVGCRFLGFFTEQEPQVLGWLRIFLGWRVVLRYFHVGSVLITVRVLQKEGLW